MGIELVVLIDGVDLGPAEGIVAQRLIERVLLYLQVVSDCIFEHVDLPDLHRLDAREYALELLGVDLHHVVVLPTHRLVLFPQRLCGLFQAVDFEVKFVLFLELFVAEVAAEIFYFCHL